VGHNTQFGGYRAAGRCSEPRGETLLLSPPQPQSITNASARPRVGGLVRGWSGVCSARTPNTDCIKQENTERAQDRCPWSPSISRRVLGIKVLLSAGHAIEGRSSRAPEHHQTAPALTLATPCFLLCLFTSVPTVVST